MKGGEYTTTIGLEIHAELATATKMFCACANAPHDSLPNTHICPICMGHPGTLPTINRAAVEAVIKVGIALEGKLADYSEFDRKNYFYPDIPKGYQISQYAYPLVRGGSLHNVAITRVHLEEDTARSLHDQGEGSIIDYNRAGVPLMELVTEPVIHSAEEASQFARELQLLLRAVGVSNANMERGEMRVEANISVGKGGVLGTKVEVKNLNSFKAVEAAIEYEVRRHIEVLEGGGTLVQETRGWDEVRSKTFSQRKKESSHDYRYFPDPDLPKINLAINNVFDISRLSEMMPELPSNKRIKYNNLGLARNQTEILVTKPELGKYFEEVIKSTDSPESLKNAGNYITSDVLGLLSQDQSLALEENSASRMADLMNTVARGEITSRVAKDILKKVVFEGENPSEIISSLGLKKSSESDLRAVVEQVLKEHAQVVLEYKGGKDSVLQFLVGQGMRLSKGAADPSVMKELLIKTMQE